MQDAFVANLGRIYGFYTGGFIGFVILSFAGGPERFFPDL